MKSRIDLILQSKTIIKGQESSLTISKLYWMRTMTQAKNMKRIQNSDKVLAKAIKQQIPYKSTYVSAK